MKTFIFTGILMLAFGLRAAEENPYMAVKQRASVVTIGSEGTGGADPLDIEAENYPNLEKLNSAVDLAKSMVRDSGFKDELKTQILAEIDELLRTQKFNFIQSLIVLGHDKGVEGYPLPKSKNHFISLGGITGFNFGDNVVFSSRTLKMSDAAFAALIIHEASHHVLTLSLSQDENFVADLTKAITEKAITPAIQKALMYGIYLPEGRQTIFAEQFLDSLFLLNRNKMIYKFEDRWLSHGETRLRKSLETATDIGDLPLQTVVQMMDYAAALEQDESFGTLRHYAKFLAPDNDVYKDTKSMYCKKALKVFESCPNTEIILFRDLFMGHKI